MTSGQTSSVPDTMIAAMAPPATRSALVKEKAVAEGMTDEMAPPAGYQGAKS
jgi:hypothetical protein